MKDAAHTGPLPERETPTLIPERVNTMQVLTPPATPTVAIASIVPAFSRSTRFYNYYSEYIRRSPALHAEDIRQLRTPGLLYKGLRFHQTALLEVRATHTCAIFVDNGHGHTEVAVVPHEKIAQVRTLEGKPRDITVIPLELDEVRPGFLGHPFPYAGLPGTPDASENAKIYLQAPITGDELVAWLAATGGLPPIVGTNRPALIPGVPTLAADPPNSTYFAYQTSFRVAGDHVRVSRLSAGARDVLTEVGVGAIRAIPYPAN